MRHFSKALVYVLIYGLLCPSFHSVLAADPRAEEIKKFQLNLEENLKKPDKQVDAADSFAYEFVSKVWSEPKYRYMAGSILVGETLIAAMLVKRMRLNKNTWNRQVETVKSVAESMKEVTTKLGLAEQEVLNALSQMSQADKANLLKALTESKTASAIPAVEKALKGEAAAGAALGLEASLVNLETAYAAWQKQCLAEARVLRAAGAVVENPAAFAEVAGAVELQMRAATGLQFTEASFAAFRNAGFQQMVDKANLGLGKGISWRAKVWRRARTGLLLLAIPVIAVGVSIYFDREMERNRRVQDLNESALADREKSAKTLIPYFHRPLLYSFVKAWETAQTKDGSLLKRFRCPLEIKAIEEENESLPIMQALALQVIMEMEQANEDVLEEDGKKVPMITEKFYKRLVLKVLEHQRSPLLNLKDKEKQTVIADIAYEAYRSFDKLANP